MERKYIVKSNMDELLISALEYIPNEIKGIVVIAHGMCEYKERYRDFALYLKKNHYLCVTFDERGHGQSVRDVEDLGYFYDNTSNYIVEDLHQIISLVKEKYKDVPIYLFGHSMGSLVVRKYIKKYDNEIDKLIVCGSPSKNSFINVAILLTKVVTLFKGDHHRDKLLQNISIGVYDRRFKEEIRNAWLNSNIEKVKEYNNDSKCGYIFTNNGFINLFKLLKDVYSKKNWKLLNKKLPILFIAGSADPVIVNEKEWMKSLNFLKKIGYSNIQYKLYKNDRHELLNEVNNKEVYEDILRFLNK